MKRLITFSVLAALCVAGCSKKPPSAENPDNLKIPVSSVEAKPTPLTKSIRALGMIKAVDSVAVYSKVNGKLVDYLIKNGSDVKKGDLIAFIDRDEVGYKYNQAPVYCPIGGVISSLPLNQGSEVRPDTPIGYVVNIDKVHVVLSLPESYRGVVKLGQKVEIHIHSLDKSSYLAEVHEIDPLIDPSTHSFTFKVLLDNPNKTLIPGLFVSGNLILETIAESIMLPEEAIVALQGEWYIYKIVSEQALLKKVTLGLRKEGKVQILSGVEPGDLVIVGGNHKVSDGQKIRNKQQL
jgi:membrane fusion protein (multidrug efflux system)